MANEQEREGKPRFQIIDNRLLTEEERKGTAPAASSSTPLIQVPGKSAPSSKTPQIIGSSSLHENPGEAVSAPIASGDEADATETVPSDEFEDEDLDAELTEEEAEQLAAQMEAEQFAQLEQEVGRPLTEEEKDRVRQMMAQRAESMSRLEVAPLLIQTVSELPRYAAVHLGLVANPYTGLIARNDAEARLAIDAFGALYETLKTRIDPRAGAELARVLNDLRSNYTRITGQNFNPPSSIITGPRIIR
ncbi:hypothetical protein IAD21_05344 [Abditibacteriota bacterium]|nr:hypothetical protein IAD21_05344 [Abditibacteriota bacterium]